MESSFSSLFPSSSFSPPSLSPSSSLPLSHLYFSSPVVDYELINSIDNPDKLLSLLKNGSNPDDHDIRGKTALMRAASHNHSSRCYQNKSSVECQCASCCQKCKSLDILIKYGANVNARAETGETALIGACVYGRYECVSLLLENGADPNAKLSCGKTAHYYAEFNGYNDCVQLLLDYGATPLSSELLDVMEREKRGHYLFF